MSKFSDSLLVVLSGGIPALIDGGTGADTGNQPVSTMRVEEIPPSGTIVDREPFNFANVATAQNVLLITAGILGVLGLIFFVRK